MKVLSRDFQIFVKPAGSLCNLSCSYCYYSGTSHLYPEKESTFMSDDTLERYIIQHIEASADNIITFSWHGGEPLLAGIDFYRMISKLQNKYKPVEAVIINGIQTNGTLINEEWCRFLRDEHFIVGISIDGPDAIHNTHRRTREDKDTFQKVIRGYELLREHGIIPEILCVVNAHNVKYPNVVYSFFRELGAKYMTFLPLVVRELQSQSGVSKDSVPSLEFGHFLSAVFDEWVEKDIGEIKIQIFEEAARTAFEQEHTLCIFKETCGGVPVIEYNGDFYSCDHFVNEDHFLGNIKDHSLSHFLNSERQYAFGLSKSLTLPDYCLSCEVKVMCNGECPKNRFIPAPDGEPGLNYLCSGYKYFFNHVRPFIDAIRAEWKNRK